MTISLVATVKVKDGQQADFEAAAHQSSDHFKTIGRQMGAFMDGPPDVEVMSELG
jgi:quinol monooxygenase YgiN